MAGVRDEYQWSACQSVPLAMCVYLFIFFYINLCAGTSRGVGRVFLWLTCSWAPAGHITKQREDYMWHSYGWLARCLSASKSARADRGLTMQKIRRRLPLYIVTRILQNVSQDPWRDGLSWSGPRLDFTPGQCVEFMNSFGRGNVKTQREIFKKKGNKESFGLRQTNLMPSCFSLFKFSVHSGGHRPSTLKW